MTSTTDKVQRLTRDQIEEIRDRYGSRGMHYLQADINALCDMALASLPSSGVATDTPTTADMLKAGMAEFLKATGGVRALNFTELDAVYRAMRAAAIEHSANMPSESGARPDWLKPLSPEAGTMLAEALGDTSQDTPRTDALDKRAIETPDDVAEVDYRVLCRQLEREVIHFVTLTEQLRDVERLKHRYELAVERFENDQQYIKTLESRQSATTVWEALARADARQDRNAWQDEAVGWANAMNAVREEIAKDFPPEGKDGKA